MGEKEKEIEQELEAKRAEKRKQKKESEDELPISVPELMEEETNPKKFKSNKNPDVDTSFLPDREREEEENQLREELRLEWVKKQESLKEEPIEITYSYWDGSGHRRTVKM